MPAYRLLIHGSNVLKTLEGLTQKQGFYTIQSLNSEALDVAKRAICKEIEEQVLERSKNNPSDLPVIDVVETQEVPEGEKVQPMKTGLLWYPTENIIEQEKCKETIYKQWGSTA